MRYPDPGLRGVMHSEVSRPGTAGSHAQWGIQTRDCGESCTVRYPDPGLRGVMHSEVSRPGTAGSHAQ